MSGKEQELITYKKLSARIKELKGLGYEHR